MKTYLTTIDGRRRRVTVPKNDDAMLDAIAAENAANPEGAPLILLVPEQASYLAEDRLLARLAADLGIRPADIRSIAAMFAPTTDPDADYRVLEVSPNATDEEIRKAYRRMSMKHHPDKVAHLGPEFQKTATAKFQRVSAAYANIKKSRGMN